MGNENAVNIIRKAITYGLSIKAPTMLCSGVKLDDGGNTDVQIDFINGTINSAVPIVWPFQIFELLHGCDVKAQGRQPLFNKGVKESPYGQRDTTSMPPRGPGVNRQPLFNKGEVPVNVTGTRSLEVVLIKGKVNIGRLYHTLCTVEEKQSQKVDPEVLNELAKGDTLEYVRSILGATDPCNTAYGETLKLINRLLNTYASNNPEEIDRVTGIISGIKSIMPTETGLFYPEPDMTAVDFFTRMVDPTETVNALSKATSNGVPIDHNAYTQLYNRLKDNGYACVLDTILTTDRKFPPTVAMNFLERLHSYNMAYQNEDWDTAIVILSSFPLKCGECHIELKSISDLRDFYSGGQVTNEVVQQPDRTTSVSVLEGSRLYRDISNTIDYGMFKGSEQLSFKSKLPNGESVSVTIRFNRGTISSSVPLDNIDELRDRVTLYSQLTDQ